MITKLIRYSRILPLFILVFSSCSPKNLLPKDEFPTLNIPLEEMNTRFKIYIAEDSGNSMNNGDLLHFIAELIDYDHSIAFDAYTYVRIFTKVDDEWVEYPYDEYVNETGNLDVHYWLFTLDKIKSDNNDISYQFIIPRIPDLNKPKWFRIFLIGSFYENDMVSDKKTAAYMDVLLKP